MSFRAILISVSLVACGPSVDGPGPTDGGMATIAGTEAGDATAANATTGDGDETGGDPTGAAEPPEPPPGEPGGLCVLDGNLPACNADASTCNVELNYCYVPEAPCEGFTCGGSDRGTCSPVAGLPACTCLDGFENETFALYCCPLAGGDPRCVG